MSRNLVKFYNTNEQEETRVIDANGMMEMALARAAEAQEGRAAFVSFDEESESVVPDGEFAEGLDAEALAALTSDRGTVIKAADPQKEAEEIIAAAQEKADAIVADAEQLAQEYKDNTRRETDIECGRLKVEAKDNGYKEGFASAVAEYEDRMRSLDIRQASLEQEYESKFASLEADFVRTITGIYEHIFKVDLSDYHSILLELIASTMREVEYSKTYIVHVSADDYSSIGETERESLCAAAPGCDVEVVEDIALGLNQCMVETDNGVFDCGLDTQLRELRKKLMLLSYNPDAEN